MSVQSLLFYGHGQLFFNIYIKKLLRYSIFECFGTSNLGEKSISHEVAKKCQPIDGFRTLQNSRPNCPWADFHHRVRISSSKISYCMLLSHVLVLRTTAKSITAALILKWWNLVNRKVNNDNHLWALGKISRRCSIQFWSVKTTFFKYSLWLDFEAYISIRMGSRDFFHVRLRLSEGVRWWNISARWLVRGHKRIVCTKPLILWAWSTFF